MLSKDSGGKHTMTDTDLNQMSRTRIGFHYFPDSTHYREKDLEIWLPELRKLKASWLVLKAETTRAIPEFFIKGLLEAGIEPIIHFNLELPCHTEQVNLEPILSSYGKWGANYTIFFDLPNMRSSWAPQEWAQNDLVKRFLDQYLPFAYQAVNAGLKPVLPPLEPGGSYWDTAFLRSVLEIFEQRKLNRLVDRMTLSAYAWSDKKPLNWGVGGPERWIETRPYYTPPNEQDQRGFRIFDWYLSIFNNIFHKDCPILLLGAGIDDHPSRLERVIASDSRHKFTNLAIGRLAFNEDVLEPGNPEVTLKKIPDQILCVNFWLLSCDNLSPYQNHAWYHPSGKKLPVVQAWVDWFGSGELHTEIIMPTQDQEASPPAQTESGNLASGTSPFVTDMQTDASASTDTQLEEKITPKEKIDAEIKEDSKMNIPANVDRTVPFKQQSAEQVAGKPKTKQASLFSRPIQHYLLLPSYDWGISDWHLEVIRPFVKKHQPTIGFSLKEAVLANKVTIIGSNQTFPDEIVERLRASGCEVERISGDGTTIATELAKR
jgi:hypothetical protein